jgi:hypothetical protein
MRMHPCYLRAALLRLPTALFLSLAVASCGSSPAAPTPPTPVPVSDAVSSVVNMNPAPGTALQLGQTVTFAGTPAYILVSADVGGMRMVIQDQANRVLQTDGTQVIAVAHRGSGDVTLSQTITLPSEGITSVRVFFVLVPAGASSSNAVLSLSYPVH